jgi:hypothetical protein
MLNERIQPDVELVTDLDVESIKEGPFANPYLKEIMRHFGKKAFGRSSACAEFESFLRDLFADRILGRDEDGRSRGEGLNAYYIQENRPLGRVCLEIGTFYGITAVLLSRFFDQVICVSVDLPGDLDMKRRIVSHLGIKNVSFYDAKDNADKARFVHAANFDFCYQDGDHTNDTRTDFDLVKRCGRVLFHEYWPLQPAVWNLVNSLPRDEVTRAKYDCLAYWERKR